MRAAGQGRLIGRVLDEDGRPVGGVDVRIEPGPHTTITNIEGEFAFDRLAGGTYSASAHKDQFYAGPTLVDVGETGQSVTLQLRLGATLIVNVFANRAPVTGATLKIEHGFSAVTDETGRATICGLAPREYRGMLLADGCADEHLMLSIHEHPGGTVERTFTLEPGARIQGAVLDSNGSPVDEVVIVAWSEKQGRHPLLTRSAADGRWHFNAQSGRYRVSANSPMHGGSTEVTFTCDGRTQHDIELRVSPQRIATAIASVVNAAKRLVGANTARIISGIVVDEKGEPASAADVRVVERRFVRTDSNGRFQIEDLESGHYEIVADWAGPWFSPQENVARQMVRTGDTNVKLVLPARGTVTGRAIIDGAPLTYFGLRLVGENESSFGGRPIGVRDAAGCFTVRHVLPGTWRMALVAPGTRLATSREFTVAKNETLDLGDIALIRGQRLSGYVRDLAGAVVAGARVIIGRTAMLTESWGASRSVFERLFTPQYETRTNADGAYVFDGIDVAREPMMPSEIVRATHFSAGASVIHEVPKTDATMDFVLLGSGRIEGTVQNMRGGRGHLLAVRADEPTSVRHAHCDKKGHFQFEDLPPGEYAVKLDVPDAEQVQPANVTVVASQTTFATLAMNSVSVKLTVTVPSGRGKDLVIEPTSANAAIGGRIRGIMSMGNEDSCSLEYVRPGTYRASLDGRRWTSITVDVSPADQSIDLRHLA